MRIIVLALVLMSCVDSTEEGIDCGEYPNPTGISAAFETINGYERVVMTRENYDEFMAWRQDVHQWSQCMLSKEQ